MGGVSPLSGLEPVLFRQRVHRLTVYTLFEDTSHEAIDAIAVNVRIYNRALSAEEIKTLYDAANPT